MSNDSSQLINDKARETILEKRLQK